jgi:hypothetical protein
MGQGLLIVSRNALTMQYLMGPDTVRHKYAVGPHLANDHLLRVGQNAHKILYPMGPDAVMHNYAVGLHLSRMG